jgi:agarase
MKSVVLLGGLAVGSLLAQVRPLPTDGRSWDGDPLLWKFRPGEVRCGLPGGHGIAVYEGAPLASNVTVEARFTPQAAEKAGWDVAAVAIVDDPRNFWHLALVQTPLEQGCKPMLELTEMRDGEWLAQANLKVEVDELDGAKWAFGEPVRLALSLDDGGVTGTILAADGRTLLRRRYAFTAAAVRRGRPALRASGFAGAFAELRASWARPAAEAPAARPAFPAYALSNTALGVKEPATGFFRVTQRPDGRWWAIDPNGCGVVLLGVDHVTFRGHWCEKLGYCPHGRKNEKKYADHAEWESETLGRLKTWGFTMLGAGCDPKLKHRGLVHTEFLSIGDHLATLGDEYDITPNERRPCSSFPNVFHPDFEAYCRYRARQLCAPCREDPWLFGYFIDNELAWWGRGGSDTGLFDAVMKKGGGHTAKAALKEFAAGRCDRKVEAFNAAFGTQIKAFDEILGLQSLPHVTAEARALKKAFLAYAADRYFSVASRAIREVDPNHLVLGARFAGTGGADPAVWEVSGKYCDVVTFNCYPMADLDEGRVYTRLGKGGEPVAEHFATYYGYVKRPMLITEWSFPALDAGLPSVHGAGQRFRTQAERTQATSLFARTMLSLPFLLGYDYFMWVDEPALGISTPFPEDSNYGLINEDGAPYAELTSMFEALQREAGAWRLKPLPQPLARKAEGPLPDALTAAKRGPAAEAAATFLREGASFRLANGRLELSGQTGDGNFVRRVSLAGAGEVGQYNALLHMLNAAGQDRWIDARTVKAVDGRVVDGVAVAEVTGAGSQGAESFDVTHRLLLPPGAPWFVSEAVSVKNTGAAPLRLKGLFFRVYSAFSEVPKALPPNLWGAPVGDCWLDGASGRFFGATASKRSGVLIDFWLDEGGRGTHPDARWELAEAVLAPGETYRPPEPVYVICVAGDGGADGWLKAAQPLKAVLE